MTDQPSPLILLGHPLSSYCQKVLIAADVMDIAIELQLLNLGDPASRAEHLARWPTGKMPVLMDQGRALGESSIVIEHLQHHPLRRGPALIPADAAAALDVRLWDRLFDTQVMTPMQALTADLLRQPDARDALGVAQARAALEAAYAFIDRHFAGRVWASGDTFSLADCAAAPALFYAACYVPIAPQNGQLTAYLQRLLDHPAVARTLDGARPFFRYFPGKAGLPQRYRDALA